MIGEPIHLDPRRFTLGHNGASAADTAAEAGRAGDIMAAGRNEPSPAPFANSAADDGGLVRLLTLVADRTRMGILRALADGERPVMALTAELRVPQPTVSHHLAWLRMMELVSPRRQGKHVFYALGPAAQFEDGGALTLTTRDATVTITPNRLS